MRPWNLPIILNIMVWYVHPKPPFQYRHAWNDNHRLSLWLIAAVPRHAHHHADAQVEHYELKALPYQAPATLGGYIVSAVAAFIPPLWQYLMTPRLLAWDATFANAIERELAAIENMRSGVPLLMEAGERYFMQQTVHYPKSWSDRKSMVYRLQISFDRLNDKHHYSSDNF